MWQTQVFKNFNFCFKAEFLSLAWILSVVFLEGTDSLYFQKPKSEKNIYSSSVNVPSSKNGVPQIKRLIQQVTWTITRAFLKTLIIRQFATETVHAYFPFCHTIRSLLFHQEVKPSLILLWVCHGENYNDYHQRFTRYWFCIISTNVKKKSK